MSDLFDYDDEMMGLSYDPEVPVDYTASWRDAIYLTPASRALENEEILRWEHELGQPDYYDYFLEEVTR